MLLLNRYKVRGNSILESVIAMTIIAICMSTAIIIYGKIVGNDNDLNYYLAQQKVKELLLEAKIEKSIADKDYNFESYEIERKVEELKNHAGVKIIFTVKTKKQKKEYKYIVSY